MFIMRPKGSADVLLARRQQAIKMLSEELSLNEIARRIECSPSSVMRWRDLWDALGEEGLRVRTATGRPPKMSDKQKTKPLKLLLQGPMAFGWPTDVWTTRRVAELIRKKFSIDYHFTHVARILHALDRSPQKPERRALERNEAAIQRWKATDWDRLKKRLAVGRLPDFHRRIGLYADPHGPSDMGTCWLHPADSSSLCQRSHLGDLGRIRQSNPKALGVVWHALLGQHRPG